MSAFADIGPNGVPRWKLYQQARELAALAALAMECSGSGARQDLPRCVATMDRMRAVLGNGSSVAGDD
jgi:hypothetical protein